MRRVILLLLLSLSIQANEEFTVSLSCSKLIDYIATCENDEKPQDTLPIAKEYWLNKQTTSWDVNGTAFIGRVKITYKDSKIIGYETNSTVNGFRVKVEPNTAFHINIYDPSGGWITHERAYRISISKTTGMGTWKRQNIESKGWRKFDIFSNEKAKMIKESEVVWL